MVKLRRHGKKSTIYDELSKKMTVSKIARLALQQEHSSEETTIMHPTIASTRRRRGEDELTRHCSKPTSVVRLQSFLVFNVQIVECTLSRSLVVFSTTSGAVGGSRFILGFGATYRNR
jgi:hypothetical protein